MSLDEGLFEEDANRDLTTDPADTGPRAIADWQVELLRKALDGRGLQDMSERQRLVEHLVGRPVTSLRALTSAQAQELLERIAQPTSSEEQPGRGSAWDTRDEETWIDRL